MAESGEAPEFVDVLYRGLRVAQRAKLAMVSGAPFVECESPMPVGTALTVEAEGKPVRHARVVHVVEQEAGAGAPGMRLGWGEAVTAPAEVPAAPAEVLPDVTDKMQAAPAAAEASGDPDASGDGEGGGNGVPEADGDKGGKKRRGRKRR